MSVYTLTEGAFDGAEGEGLLPTCHTIDPEGIESYVGSWLIAHMVQHPEVRFRRSCSENAVTWVANVMDDSGEIRCFGFLTLTGYGVHTMV